MKDAIRFAVLLRDGFTCRYCGAQAYEASLHVDHVIPRALGGGDDPVNLVTACWSCNLHKSARLMSIGHIAALVRPCDCSYTRSASSRCESTDPIDCAECLLSQAFGDTLERRGIHVSADFYRNWESHLSAWIETGGVIDERVLQAG